jgi:hypothetical protein
MILGDHDHMLKDFVKVYLIQTKNKKELSCRRVLEF